MIACLLVAPKAYSQRIGKPITASNVSIEQVLNQIEKASSYVFLYNNKTIDTRRIVSVNSKNGDIKEILSHIFRGTNVTYTIVDNQIILSTKNQKKSPANAFTLKGTVKDSQGEPLIGVSVKRKGSTTGVISDIDGNFNLQVNDGSLLEVSYIGYATKKDYNR